jgi:hypothetical protein
MRWKITNEQSTIRKLFGSPWNPWDEMGVSAGIRLIQRVTPEVAKKLDRLLNRKHLLIVHPLYKRKQLNG